MRPGRPSLNELLKHYMSLSLGSVRFVTKLCEYGVGNSTLPVVVTRTAGLSF